MMNEQINARYIADIKEKRAQTKMVSFTANPGDNIFIQGSHRNCKVNFEVLCGIRKPDNGEVIICNKNPYTMTPKEAALFRCTHIGGIPHDLGLIPEIQLIHQILDPIRCSGFSNEEVFSKIHKLTSDKVPTHVLYNTPQTCSFRYQSCAAIFRALISNPLVLVVNSLMDDLPDNDADFLWQIIEENREKNNVLIYLSSSSAPMQMNWDQQINL